MKVYKNFKFSKIVFALALICEISSSKVIAQIQTITINKGKHYQKIDGFGATGINKTSFEGPFFYNSKFASIFVEDLGATISRAEAEPMEGKNDNDNPLLADVNKFSPSAFNTAYYAFAKEAQAMANTYGDTIKFMYSIFSPPAWMKYSNKATGLNIDNEWNGLRINGYEPKKWEEYVKQYNPTDTIRDMKAEFAENCMMHTKKFKDETGFDLYGLSLQNHPEFSYSYNSCVYSKEKYREMLKVVGKRFKDEKLNTKFIMNENAIGYSDYQGFVNEILSDVEARKYFDIAGVHDYGVAGFCAFDICQEKWMELDKINNATKKIPLWQTETGGYSTNWVANVLCLPKQGFSLAQDIFKSLKYGKASAWLWGNISTTYVLSRDTNHFLIFNNIKTKNFYVLKQFARYIRPNAVSVDAYCDGDSDILPLAFQHDAKKTLTILLLNQSNTDKKVKLDFAPYSYGSIVNPTTYKVYQTNKVDNCLEKNSINAYDEIILPALSITTLVGEGSLPYLTGNDVKLEQLNTFEMYPNPTAKMLKVKISSNINTTVEIKDAYAKTVKSITTTFLENNRELDIDISDLANGIYIVQVANQSQKLIVNK